MSRKKELVDYVSRWKPDEDDVYYYVDNDGEIITDKWAEAYEDIDRYNFGNCFRTEEAAKRAADAFRELLKNDIFDNDDDDE